MGNNINCIKSAKRVRDNKSDTPRFVMVDSKTKENKERFLRPRRAKYCDETLFMECPFQKIIRRQRITHLMFHDSEVDRMVLEGLRNLELDEKHDGEFFNIPSFLGAYSNDLQGMRIRLKLFSTNVSEKKLSEYPEAAYLIQHMKYLKMWYIGHPFRKKDPFIILKESHGNFVYKSLRKFRLRDMFTRIKIIRGKSYAIFIGKDFMLTLFPPDMGTFPTDFAEGNGERPQALGYYTRMLDTNPQIFLEWEAALYDWFNDTPGPPYVVEELMDINFPKGKG